MKFIKVILFVVLLAALITFAAQNSDSAASISYFGLESATMPLYALMFIVAGVMVIVMSFVGLAERIRLKSQVRKLTKQVKELTGELDLYKGTTKKKGDAAVQTTGAISKATTTAPAIPGPKEDAPTEKKRRRFSFKKDADTAATETTSAADDTAETRAVDTDSTE